MSLDQKFNQIAEDVKHVKSRPTDDELLQLYALFKQATIGDVNTTRPGFFDLKGKAKWDAWNSKKGRSKESAKEEYIFMAQSLIDKYGMDSSSSEKMASIVKGVLPQVPIKIIKQDLAVTGSIDETITRLLDGTVYYEPETNQVSRDDQHEPLGSAAETSYSATAATDIESHATSSITALSTPSPMSFNTGATCFAKNSSERMRSYQERKQALLDVARLHYLQKNGQKSTIANFSNINNS